MGLTRILILAGAAGAGILAFWLAMSGNGAGPEIATQLPRPGEDKSRFTRVLVAKSEIEQGAVLDEEATRWMRWPADAVPDIYVTEDEAEFVEALSEKRARRTIYQNEPIFAENTVEHGDRGMLASIMTPGMRAVTARLSEDRTSGGFILPGDRVDVFATPDGEEGAADRSGGGTQLVLSNVRVLAIDQVARAEEGIQAITGRTVTLEVRPADVQRFIEARDNQSLTLVLRSVFDSDHPERSGEDPSTVLVIRYGQG